MYTSTATRSASRRLLVTAMAVTLAPRLFQRTHADVVISNMLPRTNVSGEIMDAHDGTYNQWAPGGPWYYYAMGYGTCKQGGDMCHGCGYGYSWIGVWKSQNMANTTWELVREARDSTWPGCVYFRVHVVYNTKTKLYVMWVNVIRYTHDYVIGTSTSPEGPFTFVHAVDAGFKGGGDFDVLVDDDGSGYLIYTATGNGHVMSIEKLSDDYLYSLGGPSPPSPTPPEPPQSGFISVGQGACRDGKSDEPPFYTNEGSNFKHITLDSCVSACTLDQNCTGISYCNYNTCAGACHVYSAAGSPSPAVNISSWTFKAGTGGNPSNISKVTSEIWWDCYRKQKSGFETRATVSLNLDARRRLGIYTGIYASQERDLGPTKSNVSSGVFGNSFVEAPAMFKRNGIYYALFGNCCCFCGHGSGIGVYTASAPLGPWTYHDNVGCTKPTTPGCGCGMNHGGCENIYGNSLTKAQQNFVIRVPTKDGIQYVWTGDRWQSASDGIKAHDLQYWSVLNFTTTPSSGGIELPQQFVWENEITIAT